ncbi:MAG: c-type cytochrome [Roseibacillus sp.]|jgi:mono/diheme cytochrome c family protein/glucose/arabinose dehydrogenase|nr:c-type cytochrome [Roseibacillus sp.]HJM63445.1 c-type cytochrome [Roseibacillus sp.]|tara:strand:+ start:33279 stop:35561 length:2283 start_codon:yes stop_codon:yes gene_type:complete
MSLLRQFSFLALPIALISPLAGQQGDRKGHNMASFVPEDVIPPAPFLKVEDALKSFQLAPGFVIEEVVSEPLVDMPCMLKFDGNGQMWICELVGYMPDVDGKGENIAQGRIVILTDSDDDGRVDKRSIFLEKLLLPRSLYLLDDGILWANQESLFFQGRDGNKPVGKRVLVDKDYARGGNVEHKANSLVLGLDNWIYNAKSDRRYKRTKKGWVMEKTHFRGQWGIDRDDYGRLFHNSNSTLLVGDYTFPNAVYGNTNSKMKAGIAARISDNRVWPIRVTPGVNRGYQRNTVSPENYKLINATGASGLAVFRSHGLGKNLYGTAFITEATGHLIKAISYEDGEGKLVGKHTFGEKEFLASTDERFRPVNAYTAPDNSLYILDMYHGIIQHRTYVTSYLRKQILSRGLDKPGSGHGRIYRLRHKDQGRGPAPSLQELSATDLTRHLSHPNGWWRDTAQRLIVERGNESTRGALEDILQNDKPLARLHALWCLEGLGLLNAGHVTRALTSGDEKFSSSALMAGLSLGERDKNALLPALAAFKAGRESSIYKARLLAETGTSQAFDALVAELKINGGNPLVREAAFTGLKDREAVFLGVNNGRYNDGNLDKWLQEALHRNTRKIKPPTIKGEHLASFQRGEKLYMGRVACIGCHGAEGTGLPNLGPPLDESDWVNGDTKRLAKTLLHGLQGPITVSGQRYTPPAAMPGLSMNPTISDRDIADILTFIRHAWSNRSGKVEEAFIKESRETTRKQGGVPYTEKELN